MYLGAASKTKMFIASGNDQGKEEKQEKHKKKTCRFLFSSFFL